MRKTTSHCSSGILFSAAALPLCFLFLPVFGIQEVNQFRPVLEPPFATALRTLRHERHFPDPRQYPLLRNFRMRTLGEPAPFLLLTSRELPRKAAFDCRAGLAWNISPASEFPFSFPEGVAEVEFPPPLLFQASSNPWFSFFSSSFRRVN